MDGASYHCAEGTKSLMKKLRIPVMMFRSYSFEASVCELYFAAFKNADINGVTSLVFRIRDCLLS